MKKKIKELSYYELMALFCRNHNCCKECPLIIKNEICYLDCCEIGEKEIETEQLISPNEALKVIELLNKKHDIKIYLIKRSSNLEQYNRWAIAEITQEEYDLLKRFFK